MDKYQILEQKLIYTGRAISLREDQVRLPNGRQTTREVVTHPGAVVILPKTSQGSLILIRQYRHALDKELLEFPAGTLELGEEILTCAQRELSEETGFEAKSWRELGQSIPAPGFCNEVHHLFFAEDLSPKTSEKDEDEIIEVVTLTPEEFLEKVKVNEIIDGKTMALYFRAALQGLV